MTRGGIDSPQLKAGDGRATTPSGAPAFVARKSVPLTDAALQALQERDEASGLKKKAAIDPTGSARSSRRAPSSRPRSALRRVKKSSGSSVGSGGAGSGRGGATLGSGPPFSDIPATVAGGYGGNGEHQDGAASVADVYTDVGTGGGNTSHNNYYSPYHNGVSYDGRVILDNSDEEEDEGIANGSFVEGSFDNSGGAGGGGAIASEYEDRVSAPSSGTPFYAIAEHQGQRLDGGMSSQQHHAMAMSHQAARAAFIDASASKAAAKHRAANASATTAASPHHLTNNHSNGAGGSHTCTCGGHTHSAHHRVHSIADVNGNTAGPRMDVVFSSSSDENEVEEGDGGSGGAPSRLQLPTSVVGIEEDDIDGGYIPADISGGYSSEDASGYPGGGVLTHLDQGGGGAGVSGGGGGGYGLHDGQGQALPLPPPPLAPLDRERFKAEAMELESALRAREGGMLEEGDASGQQLTSARRLRSLLSSNREELIREALDRDWVPLLMGWLGPTTRPAVQVEALWALTNIAAGATDHAQVLTNSGAVPPLVVLLDSPNEEVLEQALWLLGNLAGEGAAARDAVLAEDALPPLVRCLERHQGSRSLLKIGSWTLSNLCDGQPRPVLDVHTVIPALAKLLQHTDSEILSHTCWALSHLCDGLSTHIRAVVEADICWRLVELLMHRSWRVTKPALRTIGNIVCAEDDMDYTQHIIDAGAVPCLQRLIAHNNREIQKEACWTLSNIAAGTVEQIQTVLDSGALPSLVQLASSQPADPSDPDSGGADPEVRSEASWAVLNATSCGSDHQIEYLVQEGGIKVLGELLKQSSMVMMALEGLERILQVGDKEAYRLMVGESGGGRAGGGGGNSQRQHPNQQQQPRGNPYAALLQATKIELLETHKNSAVAKRAQRIRKSYFVRCAICKQSSSKASLRTRFCPECKCDVCRDCDCTRFHLEFQEELWKEMSEQEANARASRKSKKQKKKQKARERSKATTVPAHSASLPEENGDPGGEAGAADRDSDSAAAAVTTARNKNNTNGDDVFKDDGFGATTNGYVSGAEAAGRSINGNASKQGVRQRAGDSSSRGEDDEDKTASAGSDSSPGVAGDVDGRAVGVRAGEPHSNWESIKVRRAGSRASSSAPEPPSRKKPLATQGPDRSSTPTPTSSTRANGSIAPQTTSTTCGTTNFPATGTSNSAAYNLPADGAPTAAGGSSGKGKGQRRARAPTGFSGTATAASAAGGVDDPAGVGGFDGRGARFGAGAGTRLAPVLAEGGVGMVGGKKSAEKGGGGGAPGGAGAGDGGGSANSKDASVHNTNGNGHANVKGRSKGNAGGGAAGARGASRSSRGQSDQRREGGGVDDDSLRQNDNYVSFLNETGSILALAQMLDRQTLEDA